MDLITILEIHMFKCTYKMKSVKNRRLRVFFVGSDCAVDSIFLSLNLSFQLSSRDS